MSHQYESDTELQAVVVAAIIGAALVVLLILFGGDADI